MHKLGLATQRSNQSYTRSDADIFFFNFKIFFNFFFNNSSITLNLANIFRNYDMKFRSKLTRRGCI
ncbi:hypothetical protein HanRHA438_Chr16g0759291 [Helianthus annuus]|nr:hypothetical protein HanRHA438_Chr16g0759291 [Helianthus annuus]